MTLFDEMCINPWVINVGILSIARRQPNAPAAAIKENTIARVFTVFMSSFGIMEIFSSLQMNIETINAQIQAIAADSVAVKIPAVTPTRMIIAVKSARNASAMTFTASLNGTASPLG